MTVADIVDVQESWRLAGCGQTCYPRSHDPIQHEGYGALSGFLMATLTPPTHIIQTGPLVVNLDTQDVTLGSVPVALAPREWGLLAYLSERVGQWCAGDDILRDVWGPEWLTGQMYRAPGRGPAYRRDIHLLRVTRDRLRERLGSTCDLIVTRYASTVSMTRLERREPTP